MKNQKILIVLIIILSIGLVVEGAYLIILKKRIDKFGNVALKVGSSVSLWKSPITRFIQRIFNDDWQRDDFFVDKFKPFEEMRRMHQRFNKIFAENLKRNLGSQGLLSFTEENFFEPDIDIREDKTHYTITMDLPGMNKDKINVEIKNKILKVSGERETVLEEEKADKFFKQERSYGHFSRVISLPENIKEDEITADYKDGVLTIKIAKTAVYVDKEASGKKIQVL
ncbi:MAG: Hsp20/alpha crystallin family protein [Candidatus Omnitrophica bacterium]|nr:Hsp20/alpha crystallin family protein [Candidatus Omnitrophota bacterium]